LQITFEFKPLSMTMRLFHLFFISALGITLGAQPIDRRALVTRHNPTLNKVDAGAPFSVGNGQFVFTADVTGLQTFGDYYHTNGTPLHTLARWAWHSEPNPDGYKLSDTLAPFSAHGRTGSFPTKTDTPAGRWLTANPHQQPLAQLALDLTRASGMPLKPDDIRAINQTLDLWSGTLSSRFTMVGSPIAVTTVCDPATDTVAVRVVSPLVASGKLGLRLSFPRGFSQTTPSNAKLELGRPDSHATTIVSQSDQSLLLDRRIEATRYQVALGTAAPARFTPAGPHTFLIRAVAGDTLEFTLTFAPETAPKVAAAPALRTASAAYWEKFWSYGGAVDFTGTTDPRAAELERRVVLSQYLTALQNTGGLPPSPGGLTAPVAQGRFASDFFWCQTAHLALWDRDEPVTAALDWLRRTLPVARALAAERGLRGARWPLLAGPDGDETPGPGTWTVANQPGVLQLAELLYRNEPTTATLDLYREVVQETADCMASMLHLDRAGSRYVLGAPVTLDVGDYDPASVQNPTFELAGWARGLEIAQHWRDRLGLARDPLWERMRAQLSSLPQKDGRYVAVESTPDTWDNAAARRGSPSFLSAFGQLPGNQIDRAIMRRTLDATLAQWDWNARPSGRDFPMVAMTAARLGAPKQALDILLKDSPANIYRANGHNAQGSDRPVFLPANGALLIAVAMLAGGWDDAPPGAAPGFPRDGTWTVRAEGINRLP
jgi:hypothetical protein